MPVSDPAARPNIIPWPPILYLVALAAPWAAQTIIPGPALLPGGLPGTWLSGAGMVLIVAGVAMDVVALRTFRKVGTPFMPNQRAMLLVAGGLYERSRNPMYVGALVAFAGLALATGNPWRWLALPALALGLHRLAILREETHLEARFGEAWRNYAARVPRWL